MQGRTAAIHKKESLAAAHDESLLPTVDQHTETCLERETLDQVSNVVGKLLNDSVVKPLDVLQQALVILGDKVDCNSLTPKAARPSNSAKSTAQVSLASISSILACLNTGLTSTVTGFCSEG